MTPNLAFLIQTLQDSVVGIAAGPAEGRDNLLSKSFEEFSAVFAEELEKSAPEGEPEELMFKGLGCVGRVANLLGSMANQVQAIKDGKDQWGAPSNGSAPDLDPCSDECGELLDGAVHLVELALRSSVNEHVDLADDDDDVEADDGMNYVAVPNAEDPDNEDASIVLKSALPGELLKFATDPTALRMRAVDVGAALMLDAGVPQEQLAKAFDLAVNVGVLAKDGDMQPGAEQGGDQAADPNDLVAQLEMLGRVAAAVIMQTEHCLQVAAAQAGVQLPDDEQGQAAGGGADPADAAAAGAMAEEQEGTGTEAAPATEGGEAAPAGGGAEEEEEDPEKKKGVEKAAEAGELAKAVLTQNETLLAKVANQDALLKTALDAIELLKRAPEPAKAILAPAAVTKQQETAPAGGANDATTILAKAYKAARTDAARTEVLAKCMFKGVQPDAVLEMAKSF